MENKEEKPKKTLDELQWSSYKLSDDVLSKLKECLMDDLTITEACLEAGIRTQTYYYWCEESDEFRDLMEKCKQDLATKAKRNIKKGIDSGEVGISMDYLQRRQKSIYSTRSEVTGAEGKDLESGTKRALDSIATDLSKLVNDETPTS